MIETYNLDSLETAEVVLGKLMRNAFFIIIILLAIIMLSNLIIWLIRSQNQIRKDNKNGIKKFYYNFYFRIIYNYSSIYYWLF